MELENNKLIIKSNDFENGGYLPKKCTGFGEDMSPHFRICNLPEFTMSLAIVMDDISHELAGGINHWIIWNLPAIKEIPASIPKGKDIPALKHAKQGIGYGKNRYRGPKQPFFVRKEHSYQFTFYALDCFINLNANARKENLLKAMYGHVIKTGTIIGKYKR